MASSCIGVLNQKWGSWHLPSRSHQVWLPWQHDRGRIYVRLLLLFCQRYSQCMWQVKAHVHSSAGRHVYRCHPSHPASRTQHNYRAGRWEPDHNMPRGVQRDWGRRWCLKTGRKNCHVKTGWEQSCGQNDHVWGSCWGRHPRELCKILIFKYQMCSFRVEKLKIGNPLPLISYN